MSYDTKQREILLKFFNENKDKSFSASEIFEKLKKDNISLSAIYRNLSELEKLGKVRKMKKGESNSSFYQFVDCEECNGHIHLSCVNCGKTVHLSSKDSKELMNSVLKNSKFSINLNETVLLGKCSLCSKKLSK